MIVSCFFGSNLENEQIEGKKVPNFVKEMIGDLAVQIFDPLTILFRIRLIDWGIRAKDREVNRKIRIFKEWGKTVVQQLTQEIKRKHADGELGENPKNLIEAIVRESLKENGETVYDDESIFDEFSTFFFAGVDTTSNYLAMTIYLLAQHPEKLKKVRKEIERHMEEDDFSYENLKKCEYIEWVQKEVTRFYGPLNGNVPRECAKETLLKGVPIKKGVFIHNQPIGVHYSDEYYQQPLEFRPERWEKECDHLPPFGLVGFSGGPRTCIGKHLAALQSKIGLIKFLKRY